MFKFEVDKKYYDRERDIQIKIIKRTAKIDQTSAKNTELLRLHKGYFVVSADQKNVISLEEKQYIDYYNAYYN